MVRGREITHVSLTAYICFTVDMKTKEEDCSGTCLNERVDVQHESLSPADDELIDAGNGMRPATQ